MAQWITGTSTKLTSWVQALKPMVKGNTQKILMFKKNKDNSSLKTNILINFF